MDTPASWPPDHDRVLVVGAGIAGLACARALQDAGIPVRVVDRGRRPGGRMGGRTLHGRIVDLGASYFTVPEGSAFGTVVDGWVRRGLARPWTDTFAAIDVSALPEAAGPDAFPTKTGPLRYAAPGGLRSLVLDLADGLVAPAAAPAEAPPTAPPAVPAELLGEHTVEAVAPDGTADGIRYRAVVLAMPEPQAVRLLEPGSALAGLLEPAAWQPTIAVAAFYSERDWPADLHGAFVDGSAILSFIADDGDRRGDGAPVLVAHTTAGFARAHLADPAGAVDEVVAELHRVLALPSGTRPVWTHAHRWTHARAAPTHPEPFALHGAVGVCGDSWGGRSSVATAWASGDALGRAIAAGLRT